MSSFLTVTVIVPYFYLMRYLGRGILTMKRFPWLATIGIIVGWVGSFPWEFIAEQMFNANNMARLGGGAQNLSLLNAYFSS